MRLPTRLGLEHHDCGLPSRRLHRAGRSRGVRGRCRAGAWRLMHRHRRVQPHAGPAECSMLRRRCRLHGRQSDELRRRMRRRVVAAVGTVPSSAGRAGERPHPSVHPERRGTLPAASRVRPLSAAPRRRLVFNQDICYHNGSTFMSLHGAVAWSSRPVLKKSKKVQRRHSWPETFFKRSLRVGHQQRDQGEKLQRCCRICFVSNLKT